MTFNTSLFFNFPGEESDSEDSSNLIQMNDILNPGPFHQALIKKIKNYIIYLILE
jgi:hypothetical protein